MSEGVSRDRIIESLEAAGVPPADQIAEYMALLLEWNEKINLTGARSPEELAIKHIADVWAALRAVNGLPAEIVDVGSGCGIPGIPLAIMMPGVRVMLVERRKKKASALDSIVSQLGLDRQVKVVAQSFEEIKHLNRDAEFWFRGFLPGAKLAPYLSEFFPRGDQGRLVLMKGPAWPNEKLEIMATPRVRSVWLERFGGAAEIHYALPRNAGERVLALV